MIQSQHDCIQSQTDCLKSLNRLEAKVILLVKTINDRNEETLPNIFLTTPNFLTILTKNHDILEILTKIQFHHIILNLTNIDPLTNWQVFMRLNLKINVYRFPIL